MKVKCKLCGDKGYWDESKIFEFWAGKFLAIHHGSYFICRKCASSILDAIISEQFKINRLHEPEIKTANKRDGRRYANQEQNKTGKNYSYIKAKESIRRLRQRN